MKTDSFLRSRLRSFKYAFKGIATLFREQPNARIHLCVMVCVLLAGVFFNISSLEWCAVLICIGGVLMGEAFNSAIEALSDKVSPGFDTLIGKAKDLGAAAVLLFVFAAVSVGLIIFVPKLLVFFF